MADSGKNIKYMPGFYTEQRSSAADLADRYIREWDREQQKIVPEDIQPEKLFPTICFSRIIGVGAVEIADILAKKIGYRVVDRQILEHITNEIQLSKMTTTSFDQRYPGEMSKFLSHLFKKTSFPDNDYNRHLFATIRAIAGLGSTIFIGWGTHLVLPRDRIMAVRFVCSKTYRVKRLASILNVEEKEIERKLEYFNLKQSYFYKEVFNIEGTSTLEFDLVINCDYINDPQWAAEIVEENFKKKFSIKQ